jgi:hypothetical protein
VAPRVVPVALFFARMGTVLSCFRKNLSISLNLGQIVAILYRFAAQSGKKQ